MEKALKAVLYFRNANSSCLRDHSLVNLASEVGDDTLVELARQLEGRVGNHMRMRYPDVLTFPKIPADVYGADDASAACSATTCALDKVKDILNVSMLTGECQNSQDVKNEHLLMTIRQNSVRIFGIRCL